MQNVTYRRHASQNSHIRSSVNAHSAERLATVEAKMDGIVADNQLQAVLSTSNLNGVNEFEGEIDQHAHGDGKTGKSK